MVLGSVPWAVCGGDGAGWMRSRGCASLRECCLHGARGAMSAQCIQTILQHEMLFKGGHRALDAKIR